MNKAEKLRVLGEVQVLLGVEDETLPQLPQLLQALLKQLSQAPCLVTFAFNPATGKLLQLATSVVPRVAEAYQGISQVATSVAQQFSKIALEVAKGVGEETGVERSTEAREDDELGTGDGMHGHEVGEVPTRGPAPDAVGE